MKILISIIFIALFGCTSEKTKIKINNINTSLFDGSNNIDKGKAFTIKATNFDRSKPGLALMATEKLASKLCKEAGFRGTTTTNNNYKLGGLGTMKDRALDGYHEYHCLYKTKEKKEADKQIVLIDKAKELCTNIGYTPNTDSHRGCVVELMKVDSGGTNVTVNSTNYQDMIDRGICMTTGKCDITGQPIIKNQSTITNSTCRVTGTGAWKTIQCF